MSEVAAATTMASADSWGKYHFLVRRLHSLSGLVPIGVYVVIHLLTNASVLLGADEFQKSVNRIHALGPLLVAVEIAFIFIPLAFHSVLGFAIWFTADPNATQYRYGPNIRYTLQRWTGGIAFFFILYHLWQLHWFGGWTGMSGAGSFQAEDAARSTAEVIQRGWWVAPLYAIGVVATVFHLANGIWTALITWGITVRRQSQRISGYVCAVFGVALALVGLGALTGFKNLQTGQIPVDREAAHALRTSDLDARPLRVDYGD